MNGKKVVKGTAEDVVITSANTLIMMVMHEAYEHIERNKFADVECLTEECMKRLAVLGRTLVELDKELSNKDGILKDILVNMTMEKVIEGAEEATAEDLAGLDEEDVTEEYVPNPSHIDPMFG